MKLTTLTLFFTSLAAGGIALADNHVTDVPTSKTLPSETKSLVDAIKSAKIEAAEKEIQNELLKGEVISILNSGDLDNAIEKRLMVISQRYAQKQAEKEAINRAKQTEEQEIAIKEHMPLGNFSDEAVRGNLDADITLVMYSDFSCPYCTKFHKTAKKAVAMGDVNWVYRHYPIRGATSSPAKLAYASECIKEMSNDQTYWEFIDGVFDNHAAQGDIDKYVAQFATSHNMDLEALTACQNDSVTITKVTQSGVTAQKSKLTGTPAIILYNNNTEEIKLLPGAVNIEQLKKSINKLKAKS